MGRLIMNHIYWITEYGATFTKCFLCSIFCGTFIENTNLKQNFLKRFIVSNIAAVLMIFVNHIELYSFVTVICGLLMASLTQLIIL